VTNTGTATSGTISVAIAGADAASFGVASDGCSGHSLAVGAACTVAVTFHPAMAGAKSASLSFVAAPGGSAVSALTGSPIGSGSLNIMPTSFDFGMVPVGTASADATFTVTNSGGAPVGPLSAHFTGAGASLFSFSNDACSGKTLAPKEACTLHAHFAPDDT